MKNFKNKPKLMLKKSLVRTFLSTLTGTMLTFTIITTSAWADFTAQINTNSVVVNDAFELTLSSDDISQRSIPDLTPLENNFKILGMSQSLQTHIVNGYTTRKHNWIITLSPKIAGQLSIPSMRLGAVSTAPINIQSLEQGQIASKNNQAVSITTSLDSHTNTANVQTNTHNNHYIFQEIPLTVRIETSQPVAQAQLIMSDVPNVEIEQQGEDKASQIIRNGQPITVIERQYILRPQNVGTFEIPPIVIKGNFRSNQRIPSSQFGFDEFFNRQFNNPLGEEFVAKTDTVTLDIKANPNRKNEWFLPAKAVEMFSEWQEAGQKTKTPTLKAGEPITRQISIVAVGATPEQLPKIEMPEVDGVRLYIDDDKTEKVQSNKGIVARRVVSVSVVPEYGGEFTLPEIKVKWHNTETDKAEIATLPAETIKVLDVDSKVDNSSNINNTVANANESAENPDSESRSNEANSVEEKNWLSMIGKWGGAGLLLLILAGYIYRKRKSASLKKLATGNSQDENGKQIDNISTVKNALIDIESDIHQSLDSKEVENLYQALMNYKTATANGNQKIDQKKLSRIIEQLEQSLYGKTEQVNFKDLSHEVSALLSTYTTVDGKKKPATELPSLYGK